MALSEQYQTPMSRATRSLYQQYKQANPPRPGGAPPMVGPIQVIAGQDEGYQNWLSQNPMANAQAMATQGVTVPTEIQRAVFQEAGAKNMTAQDLESFFGMPAGTAGQTAAALGIADSVPESLGGRSGVRPPPMIDPSVPGPTRPVPGPSPIPPPPPPPPIPPERSMAEEVPQGQQGRPPEQSDPIGPIPQPPPPIPQPPPPPQDLRPQRPEPPPQEPEEQPIVDSAPRFMEPLERAQAEFAATGQVSPEVQIAAFEQASEMGMPPSQLEQMFGMPAGTAAQFASQNQLTPLMGQQGGIGSIAELGNTMSTTYVDPVTGLPTHVPPTQGQNAVPTFRPDGNYTQDEVAQVTQMLQDGTMTFEQASDIYQVPVEQIQQNYAELSPQQPPPPQTPGYRTLPVEPPIPTPVTPTPTPVTPTPTPVTPTAGGGGGSLTPGLDGLTIDMEGGAGTLTGGEGTFTPEIGGGGTPTLPDPNVTPGAGTLTPGAGTLTPGAGGTQTFDTTTIAGLINKYKTAPDQITEADTRSLIDMAKQQNMDTSTLANMAGVSQDFLTQNLANLGYSADYLRSTPTTNLTPVNPTVTTPTGATTTIQREAPAIEARKLGIIDLAKTLAEKEPAGGLPAYQVAGLSPLEQEAYRMAQANRGVYQNATLAGAETLGQVKRGLQDTYRDRIPISDYGTEKYLSEYDPFVTSGVGTMLQARNQAGQAGQFGRNAALAGIGSLGEGRARTRGAGDIGYATTARGIRELAGTTGQFDPATGTSSYMNPYETAVIDAAMGDLTRAGEQQKQALRARAVQAGAFGGNRAALAESELDRNLLQQQAKTAAGLRAQGYGQAQQNAMTAFENAQQRGQRAGQLIGGMGTQAAQVGLQAGRGLGDFASSISTMGQQGAGTQLQGANTLGNLAGLTGRLGESRSKLGLQGVDQYGRTTQDIIKMGDLGRQIGINQGEMGRLGQDINIRDIASLEAAGQAERAANQRALDATRATRMQDIQEPYQRVGFMSDVLRGAPSSQMQMTKRYDQQPSAAAQAIGGIGSLASTAAGARAANII